MQVTESFCSFAAGRLVLTGAAEGEVPNQPPQHHKPMCLGALMPEDYSLCEAGADLEEERQCGYEVSPSCSQSSQAAAQRRGGLLDPGSCLGREHGQGQGQGKDPCS